MISNTDLSHLSFADFLPEGAELSAENHYEWMNGLWRYEGIGFSWFGAPMDEPGGTACFELFADSCRGAVWDLIARTDERPHLVEGATEIQLPALERDRPPRSHRRVRRNPPIGPM